MYCLTQQEYDDLRKNPEIRKQVEAYRVAISKALIDACNNYALVTNHPRSKEFIRDIQHALFAQPEMIKSTLADDSP